MKNLKFRSWDQTSNTMHPGFGFSDLVTILTNPVENGPGAMKMKYALDSLVWMQFTGLLDKNGEEIYEGDIFRIEEETEGPDFRLYVVIVWVQEWAMFCTLRTTDEYPAYLASGIDALDEPMFWTYTLEDTNSRKHFLCGNVFQNPELLQK